ncbi:MAG: 3-hydroxyacyl-CoA dehydrogenase [Flavobacteriales bacterium]|nr:3-hydroxyacyl-CoA dehydrogenase [Flavobacteriales bacterium]
MRIAVIGTPNRIDELSKKIASEHELVEVKNNNFNNFDLIFDLTFDEQVGRAENYAGINGMPVIVGAVKTQLERVLFEHPSRISCHFIGMNTLPTFINRPVVEMTSTREEERTIMAGIAAKLGWDIQWVQSRVGMVTPRIICMIINEAYYTVQEGTASRSDIDTAMKLGTAYPFGPFEWCERIGVKNVYTTLEAIYQDTHDERYKVCPLLKTEYLSSRAKFNF